VINAGWLRENLLNPMAFRLSSVQKPSVPDAAFSVSQVLKAPLRILVIADSRPGALFMAASQFWAIRNHYPDAQICLLARADRAFIAREIPFVDQVLTYEDFWLPFGAPLRQVVQSLQKEPFDLAFCFSTEPHFCPAYLCYKSGARIRIGFQRDHFPFFNIQIVPKSAEEYEEQRLSLMLRTLGIPQVQERVSWSISRESAQKIQNRFLSGRKPHERFVALDVSTPSGQRLPDKQFLEIAKAIVEETASRLLVFFNFNERKIAHQIQDLVEQHALLFETDDLPKIVALLSACDRTIACNTDLFHLSVSMDLPTQGIFSTPDVSHWVPASQRNIDIFNIETLKSWTPEQVRQAVCPVAPPVQES